MGLALAILGSEILKMRQRSSIQLPPIHDDLCHLPSISSFVRRKLPDVGILGMKTKYLWLKGMEHLSVGAVIGV